VNKGPRRRCHRHRAGEQGTGDDATASLSALLPLLTRTVVIAPHPRHPPTAFHRRLQLLLIVEYVTSILAHPPISINIPPKRL
jgi:hypothetical protein